MKNYNYLRFFLILISFSSLVLLYQGLRFAEIYNIPVSFVLIAFNSYLFLVAFLSHLFEKNKEKNKKININSENLNSLSISNQQIEINPNLSDQQFMEIMHSQQSQQIEQTEQIENTNNNSVLRIDSIPPQIETTNNNSVLRQGFFEYEATPIDNMDFSYISFSGSFSIDSDTNSDTNLNSLKLFEPINNKRLENII